MQVVIGIKSAWCVTATPGAVTHSPAVTWMHRTAETIAAARAIPGAVTHTYATAILIGLAALVTASVIELSTVLMSRRNDDGDSDRAETDQGN
jgi:hypothetical protein